MRMSKRVGGSKKEECTEVSEIEKRWRRKMEKKKTKKTKEKKSKSVGDGDVILILAVADRHNQTQQTMKQINK